MGLERINILKKQMGITTEELSERSGIPAGTLNKILSGQTNDPKLETVKAIARVFGCSIDEFADDDNVFSKKSFAVEECELIERYRSLDSHGKSVVDTVLDLEYKRCLENRKTVLKMQKDKEFAVYAARNLESGNTSSFKDGDLEKFIDTVTHKK